MSHGKIYKLKRGKRVHVGDIDGGFLQYLLPLFGPMVGDLLSGVAKKVFGTGQHVLKYEGHTFMLPDTEVHKKGGKGILDIIGSIFKPLLGGEGIEDSSEDEDEGGAAFGSSKGAACFGTGAAFGSSKGAASFSAGGASFPSGSLNGTFGKVPVKNPMHSAAGSKKKKPPITAKGVKSINLNRIQNPLPIISSQGGRTGKGKQLGVEPIDIYRLA